VILLHGYGADASDLAPLARAMRTSKPLNWLFPNAPLSVPLGAYGEGRAWFPLRLADLQSANQGQPIDLSEISPPGSKRAREDVFAMIKALGVPTSRVILGGFSQGAMVATDVSLRLPEPVAGLVILSGALVDASNWKNLAANRQGLPFFQSHGRWDEVLNHAGAEQLSRLLKEAGMQGDLISFDGGHEIPLEVLSRLGQFLNRF